MTTTDRTIVEALLVAFRGRDQIALRELAARGAGLEAIDEGGRTCLARAAAEDDVDVVEWILAAGADPDAIHAPATASPPLHCAAARGEAAICRLLLDAGASVDRTDHDGVTALGRAGSREVATGLLEAGADPDRPDRTGRSPRETRPRLDLPRRPPLCWWIEDLDVVELQRTVSRRAGVLHHCPLADEPPLRGWTVAPLPDGSWTAVVPFGELRAPLADAVTPMARRRRTVRCADGAAQLTEPGRPPRRVDLGTVLGDAWRDARSDRLDAEPLPRCVVELPEPV